MGCVVGNGFEVNASFTMVSAYELGFKRLVIDHSVVPFVVSDSSKACITLPVKICDCSDEFTLLTNVLTQEALTSLDEFVLSGKIVEVRE